MRKNNLPNRHAMRFSKWRKTSPNDCVKPQPYLEFIHQTTSLHVHVIPLWLSCRRRTSKKLRFLFFFEHASRALPRETQEQRTFQISISRADDAVSRHERHFAYWCLQFYREKRMISLSAPLNRCERQTRGMEECTSGDLFAAVFRQSFPRNGFRQSTFAFNMIDIKPGWLDVSKACSRDFPRQAVCHSIPMIYSAR